MTITDIEHLSTWGTVPFGSSQIQVRHIVFWIGIVVWFALTLIVTQVQSITAFAFNLTFLISLIVVSCMVRSATLTMLTSCFCAGGFFMSLLLLITQPLGAGLQANPLIRPFVLVPLEETARALPVLYLLWQGRRFSLWTMGATDLLLLGAAAGAGFGFVEDAYAHSPGQVANHFFVLMPNVEIVNGHLSCGAAVWGAISFGCLGLALLQFNRPKLLVVLAALGFVVAFVDHLALNYILAPNVLPWLVGFFNAITVNGYVAIAFFGCVAFACLGADMVIQISSLPKSPEFKLARLKDRNERLDQLWDCILDLRRLAYATFRLKHLKGSRFVGLKPADMALAVAVLSKRVINRFFNTGLSTTSTNLTAAKPQVVYVDSLPLAERLDLPERYQIFDEIGTGGMGVIYKAKHRTTGADLAIKVMHPQHSSNASHLMRFEQEARTAATLHHPNIVLVHDFGVTERSIAYLVMEWLDGPNLEKVMKQSGRMNLNRFIHIFEQCAAALSHSHKKGIIHRDVKPSNIILTSTEKSEDWVKIVDFGIAKVLSTDEEETLKLTQTGEVLGSPKFMSPEQCMGKPMDYRSDIYSLGCVMYEAIVGVAPLAADNQAQMFYKHMFQMPERPSQLFPELEMPDLIEPILFKTLQKDPDKRYNSMEELESALNQIKIAHFPG